MKHMLDKLSGKPEAEEGDSHAEAKLQVLKELREMAMDMMGERMRDKLPHEEMHGVEVMAPDKEGLEKGLDMAKEVLPDSEEAEAQPDMESDEDDMDEDEINSLIAELQAKKDAKRRL